MSEANVEPRSGGRSQKPGCVNNTLQKALLAAAGHTVLAKNLLTKKWTPMRLRPFFGDLPVEADLDLETCPKGSATHCPLPVAAR